MSIPFSKLDRSDILFTHLDSDTGTQTHYAISRISALEIITGLDEGWIKAACVPIDNWMANYCMNNRGIEQHRLQPLLDAPIPFTPMIFVEQDDGTYLLIDGTHRYAAYHKRGTDQAPAYLISKEQNRRFVVTGFPKALETDGDSLLKSFSGIPA